MAFSIMLLSLLLLCSSLSAHITRNNCDGFFSASCPVTEDTLVDGGFQHTDTAQQCQDICRSMISCVYFTWFEKQCYLLSSCEFVTTCDCCVSGPGLEDSEDVDTCISGCGDTTTSTTTSTTTTSTAPTETTTLTSTITTASSTTATSTTTLSTTSTSTTPSSCGPAWHEHSTSCYSLISGYTNLEECNQACVIQGGYLTSIHDQAENDFLEQLLRDDNKTIALIGAVFFNDVFTWLDGTYVDFLNWAEGSEGQPDHHNCVGLGLDWDRSGTWDDVTCVDFPGDDCVCKKSL